MKKLIKCKKGNFADVFISMPVFLYLGVIIVLALILFSTIGDVMNRDVIVNNTGDTNVTEYIDNTLNTSMPLTLDLIIPFIYVALLFFSIVMARRLDISNKMVLAGVIALIVLFFISLFFENIWYQVLQMTNIFGNTANSTFFTKHFLNNLRWFVLIYGGLVGLALYTKDE